MTDYALAEAFVQIRPDTTGFRAETETKIKSALAGLKPEVTIKVKPDLTGFTAAIKKALADALGSRRAAVLEVPMRVVADEGSINDALRRIKQRMASTGVADFLDYNLPLGKLQYQAQLLKRMLGTVGLADFLGVNLKPGQTLAGAAALREAVQRELKGVNIGVGLNAADVAAQAAAAKAAAIAALGGKVNIPVTETITPEAVQPLQAPGAGDVKTQAQAAASALLMLAAAETNAKDAAKLMYAANVANNIALGDTAKEADAASGAGGGGGGMGRLGGVIGAQIPLWGGLAGAAGLVQLALHGTVEAFIAIVPAALALGVTLYGLSPAAQDIYNHLNSIDIVNTNLGSNIPPLTGKFAALQSALAPAALELYGGGLNLINRNTGVLGQTLTAVSHQLETWIANIDIWAGHQQNIGRILQTGVAFLHQWGTVFGELGMAINNLSKADPGIAHMLLDVIQGFAKVLDFASRLPTPLLTIVLALHGLYFWGGLATTGLQKLAAVSGFDALLTKMGLLTTETEGAGTAAEVTRTKFLGLASGTWAGIIALGAALAYVAYQSTQADKNTKDFLASLDASLNQLPASQALLAIPASIKKINTELQNFQPPGTYSISTIAGQARAEWQDLGTEVAQLGRGDFAGALASIGHVFGAVFTTGQANSIAFANAVGLAEQHINTYINSLGRLGQEMADLGKKGFTAQQALALMDLAGVQASDSFTVMQQKVANLITGYQNMSVRGDILSNSVNAVTLATEIQNSKISQLTGAWSTFFQLVTGGLGGFTTFEQDLVTLTNKQLPGLSSATLTTQQNFLAAAQAAQTEANALMQQASAAGLGSKGTDLLTSSVKDMVAQMLPAAKHSQDFTTILYALAQQGGYHGANSFQALSQWVNTASGSISAAKDPSKQLDKNISTLAADSANLTTDMNNLANAISQNLNQAMAQAMFQADGGQKAFDNFANAVKTSHGSINDMLPSAQALASELINTTGDTNAAHREFDVFAGALGLSKQAADKLWQQSLPQLQSTINSLHGKSVFVDVTATASGGVHVTSNAPGAVPYSIFFHAKRGGKVPGFGSGDIVPALLEPGEVVVDKVRARKLGPLFKAMGVRGFQAGGTVTDLPGLATLAGYDSGIDSALADRAEAQKATAALKAFILGLFRFHGGGGGGVANAAPGVITVARYFMQQGATRAGAAGIGSVVAGESGGNPEAVQAGGGGRGILQWTPGSSAFPIQPIITGNPSRDMGVQLLDALAYVNSRGGLGPINAAGRIGWIQAAQVMSSYEAPAVPGSDIVLSVGQQLYAMGLDRGGWLPPGVTVAVNKTGRHERVVAPGEGMTVKLQIDAPAGNAYGHFLAGEIRKYVKGQGGDVQIAFGSV